MSIVLEHVGYTYMPGTPFEQQALKDVSATIEQGSLTAIAGHTGSGKSTLLQQFNGLLQPTAGRVLVDGVDINPKAKKERAAARAVRLKVGMVFQYAEQQLFEEFDLLRRTGQHPNAILQPQGAGCAQLAPDVDSQAGGVRRKLRKK